MRTSQTLYSGMPTGKKYMGWWGAASRAVGGLPQKNIVQYSVSEYRINPLQGILGHHITQGTARILHQLPYVLPPFIVAYGVLTWAKGRNEYCNTKEGHANGYVP